MARLNTPKGISTGRFTHEGAPAKHITPLQELQRSVMACMLWEDTFYESGEDIAERIQRLVAKNKVEDVAMIARKARSEFRLRHAPLLIVCAMAKHFNGKIVGDTVYEVIQRADELTEVLAMYWKLNGQDAPLAKQLKIGLARAFTKFNEYQLAKYNREGDIKLRDVLFLVHAKPKDKAQEAVWKRLVEGTLQTPDTWETNLSAGADKAETFTRLITEKKLGYMALLRNLRNMKDAGVPRDLVAQALIEGAEHSKALPFRFIAAGKMVPGWESTIDAAMLVACKDMEKLPGHTAIAVDCSGSMSAPLSGKSMMTRFDAAAALAILVREIAEECTVYAYGDREIQVPDRRGIALRDTLRNSKAGWGTDLGRCVRTLNKGNYDRMIVITDEQSRSAVPGPNGKGYVINFSTYKNGVGYGPWMHIDGFSEAIISYIQAYERGE